MNPYRTTAKGDNHVYFFLFAEGGMVSGKVVPT